ncbi:MAG: tetratricopeptide repeat protein [Pseudomonadota bacterium]
MAINRNKILKSAQKFVQKGQLKKAIKEYSKIIEDDPKDVRTLLKLGDLYSKRDLISEAIETYQSVANYYTNDGFYLKAIAVYKQILKIKKEDNADIFLKLADLFHQLGLVSDAIQNYNIVAEEYEQKGKKEESLGLYKKIANLNPDNIQGKIKLADMYQQGGYTDQAIDELKTLVVALKEKGDDEELVRILEKLHSLDSNDAEILKDLCTVYLRNDEAKKALMKLQVAYKTNPEDAGIMELLAQTFIQEHENDKAVSVLEELQATYLREKVDQKAHEVAQKIAELTGNTDVSSSISGVSSFTGESDQQMEAGQVDAIYADETSTVSSISKFLTEADVFIKYGLLPKAINQIDKVLKEDSDNLIARAKLKDIYLKQNNTESAVAELLACANICQKKKDKTREKQYLNEVLSIDAENTEAQSRLEVISTEDSAVSDDVLEQEVGSEEIQADIAVGEVSELDLGDLNSELIEKSEEHNSEEVTGTKEIDIGDLDEEDTYPGTKVIEREQRPASDDIDLDSIDLDASSFDSDIKEDAQGIESIASDIESLDSDLGESFGGQEVDAEIKEEALPDANETPNDSLNIDEDILKETGIDFGDDPISAEPGQPQNDVLSLEGFDDFNLGSNDELDELDIDAELDKVVSDKEEPKIEEDDEVFISKDTTAVDLDVTGGDILDSEDLTLDSISDDLGISNDDIDIELPDADQGTELLESESEEIKDEIINEPLESVSEELSEEIFIDEVIETQNLDESSADLEGLKDIALPIENKYEEVLLEEKREIPAQAPAVPAEQSTKSLSNSELSEIDFFIAQSMFIEAKELIDKYLDAYPGDQNLKDRLNSIQSAFQTCKPQDSFIQKDYNLAADSFIGDENSLPKDASRLNIKLDPSDFHVSSDDIKVKLSNLNAEISKILYPSMEFKVSLLDDGKLSFDLGRKGKVKNDQKKEEMQRSSNKSDKISYL